MTRKDALQAIKAKMDYYESDKRLRRAIETLIPELVESEDERIRKELKEAFEAYDIESKWNGIPIRSIFAWLEKQKEQKPEWSEEDEKMLRTIISDGSRGVELDPKQISWLKSLRPSWKPSEDELTKKHLEGYIKGRNDALREVSDFMELHFNTQSGTSIKSGGNE